MIKTRSSTIAALTAAALVLSTAGIVPAYASAQTPAAQPAMAHPASAGELTEFSSQRRKVRRNYRNDAAAAAAFTAIIGGIATYAAAREYRKAQERRYQYYAAPYGYQPYQHGYYRPHRGYRHW